MKITILDGFLQATAETQDDNLNLLSLSRVSVMPPTEAAEPITKRPYTRHKKWNIRTCWCGKRVKGKKGMAVHSRFHRRMATPTPIEGNDLGGN